MHFCRCNLHIFSITVFATTALCGDARVNAFFHLMHHSWYNFWDWIPPGWHHVVKSAGDGFRQKMSAKRKQCWAVSSAIDKHGSLWGKKKWKLHNFPVFDEENTWDSELFPDKYDLKHIIPWWPQLPRHGFKKNNVLKFFYLAVIDLLCTCFNLLAETTGWFPISTDERFQLDLWGEQPEYLNEQLIALS